MSCELTIRSVVECEPEMAHCMSAGIRSAMTVLTRDFGLVLNDSPEPGSPVRLCWEPLEAECYILRVTDRGVELRAGDEMGFIYGLYGISRRYLGVLPFWFWNDRQFNRKDRISLSAADNYRSRPFRIRFRGWFVNDEVLIDKWQIRGDAAGPWAMVFEALLRCGGNMVIPGTDQSGDGYRDLASGMGLIITHHHAEPLGAEMFSRAYPDLTPSYAEHSDLFHRLWEAAVIRQKEMKVIWNLGFRGQGDCPFWENDPRYDTPAARGSLISRLLRQQYDLVRDHCPDAVCCVNLYGETMELYQGGYLDIPETVIKIWADNGYGKMVSRRQENHNPRIPALPEPGAGGKHGIYYHVSFYDLQAANHITMLTNSEAFVCRELEQAVTRRADDFWVVNCSNVKPHVYYLWLIARLWSGAGEEGGRDNTGSYGAYIDEYFSGEDTAVRKKLAGCYHRYGECAVAYGEWEDEHAGEQFCNHGTRVLANQWLRNAQKTAAEFCWACPGTDLAGQIEWFYQKGLAGSGSYRSLVAECEQVMAELSEQGRELLADGLLLHSRIYYHCYDGMVRFGRAFRAYQGEEYKLAFYHLGMAAEAFGMARESMDRREHGIWTGFYANECLTDIRQTVWVLEGLMSFIRALDDGPHYYKWQREFLYSEQDRRVLLLLNKENHLTDREIFPLMKQTYASE